MNPKITNNMQQQTADQLLSGGLVKHETDLPFFFVNGAPVKSTDVVTTLQKRIDTAIAAGSARATWQTAVQASREEHATSKPLVAAVKQALMVAFANQPDKLADFGLNPRKPRVVSPEVLVAAAQKAKATREARHTMGKKQKQKITGATPVAPVAPTATASGPAASPAVPAMPALSTSTQVPVAPAAAVTPKA